MMKFKIILLLIISFFIIHEDSDISKLGIKNTYAGSYIYLDRKCYHMRGDLEINGIYREIKRIESYVKDNVGEPDTSHMDWVKNKYGVDMMNLYFFHHYSPGVPVSRICD